MGLSPRTNHRHFLVKPDDIHEEKAVLTVPAEIHHLVNVLRLTTGEKVLLLDGSGGKYLSQVETITPKRVEFKILSANQAGAYGRTPLQLTLAMALVKRQAMDFIIEKAVEFGVTEIVPLKTERSIVDIQTGTKQGRWERIIQASAKQSGQAILPTIRPVTEFDEFLETHAFFLTPPRLCLAKPSSGGENFAKVLLEKKDLGKKICLMIGPEGGWSQQEEAKAVESGAIPVRLADNTLRCETAVVAALALLVNIKILKDL